MCVFMYVCRYEVVSVGFLWCVEKAMAERDGVETQSPERSDLLSDTHAI